MKTGNTIAHTDVTIATVQSEVVFGWIYTPVVYLTEKQ